MTVRVMGVAPVAVLYVHVPQVCPDESLIGEKDLTNVVDCRPLMSKALVLVGSLIVLLAASAHGAGTRTPPFLQLSAVHVETAAEHHYAYFLVRKPLLKQPGHGSAPVHNPSMHLPYPAEATTLMAYRSSHHTLPSVQVGTIHRLLHPALQKGCPCPPASSWMQRTSTS